MQPAAEPRAGVVDAAASPHEQSLAASRALLDRTSAVVVSTATEVGAGSATARRLGLPLLVAGPGLAAELDRLGVRTVVQVVPPGDGSASLGGDREVVSSTDTDALAGLSGLPHRPAAHGAAVVLAPGASVTAVVEATVDAVGADRIQLGHSDPRLAVESFEALRAGEGPVLGLGGGLGPAERLAQRVRTVRHATELPGGGCLPFPGRRMVALYGHPGTASMGMLGEQSAAAAVTRATTLAQEYAGLTDTPVVPSFEIIATVASRSKGADGTYSSRTPMKRLLPWVEAAEAAGVYVVLDLQPGRTDFLEQAKHYEELLRRPWVGLALDPEWRLREDQVHLEQIGSVGVDEVNRVGAWLAALVREHDLPPKVLTLHQFRPSMIRDRERLDTSLDEVQWLVHADGLGGQGDKQATWRALRRDLPEGVWLGWKNFEDEDTPMLTPEQTMAQVQPTPWFVSYQ
ncbi:MAG TPA: hypothetical protein VLQ78_02235 [Ornithinibacter sp.]|nr:hypothetical protein [Ornithinibacter sp.]